MASAAVSFAAAKAKTKNRARVTTAIAAKNWRIFEFGLLTPLLAICFDNTLCRPNALMPDTRQRRRTEQAQVINIPYIKQYKIQI
ncbi:MAG: hypothetical protein BWY75_02105 [bacterium ADurb.Bin425]|nr:MAG: hypothetical protein BWY75_02105 [bacterium ADurb.Bin425]